MTYQFDSPLASLQHRVDTPVAPSCGEDDHAGKTARKWEANHQFIAMLNGYRRSGGLAQAKEVASMCHRSGTGSLGLLADGIVKRHLISIDWQSRIWLPLFQFNRPEMSLREGLRDVLAELVVACSAWDIAYWFSQPNPWLFHGAPADMLARSVQDVVHAARAERYVAEG